MITKILSFISFLVFGFSMIADPTTGISPARTGNQPASFQAASPANDSGADAAQGIRNRLLQFAGDRLVRGNLILATVSATGLNPVVVLQDLKDGKSIAQIAEAAGKTPEDVLGVYNETARYLLDQAAAKTQRAANLEQLRLDWATAAGKLAVDLPKMAPAFPGLAELRVAAFAATMQVTGLDRAALQAELHAGATLNDVLVKNGYTSQDALDKAMQRIDPRLDQLVQVSKLTDSQRQDWSSAIRDLLDQSLNTPGSSSQESGAL